MSDYITCSDASSRRNGPSEAEEQQQQPQEEQEQQQQQQEQEPELLEDYRRVAQAEVVPLYLGLGRSHARVRSVAGGFSFCVLLLDGELGLGLGLVLRVRCSTARRQRPVWTRTSLTRACVDTYDVRPRGLRAVRTPHTYQPRACRTYRVPWHPRRRRDGPRLVRP